MGMGFQETGAGGLSNYGGNPFLTGAGTSGAPDMESIWGMLMQMLGGLGPNGSNYAPTGTTPPPPGISVAQPGQPNQQILQPGQKSSLPGTRAPAPPITPQPGTTPVNPQPVLGGGWGGYNGGFRGQNPWNSPFLQ